jgi:hypothetical protein
VTNRTSAERSTEPPASWSRASLAGRDVGIGYGALVVVVGLALALASPSVADAVVRGSSTNLDNLRLHPPLVLVVSAVVEPSLWDLWIVVPLVWALGELQRRLGRAAVVVAVALGHVGATLFVATILTAGIAHGRVALSAAAATDVGVSYGLATVLGLLTAGVRPPRRRWFRLVPTVGFIVVLWWDRTFTDLGHLAAWVVGLGLSVLVVRAEAMGRQTGG